MPAQRIKTLNHILLEGFEWTESIIVRIKVLYIGCWNKMHAFCNVWMLCDYISGIFHAQLIPKNISSDTYREET